MQKVKVVLVVLYSYSMEEIIQSLKEFVWDIIGYLIPGFVLLVFFNFFTVNTIGVKDDFFFDWNIFGPYLIIVVSWVLGFVVYSISNFKRKLQDAFILYFEAKVNNWMPEDSKILKKLDKYVVSKHSQNWQISFENSATVKSAREYLKTENFVDVDEMKLNEMRNILMSRHPEMDEKVYTFMFRSSVFDHLGTIMLLVSIIGVFQLFIGMFFDNILFIKTESTYRFLYVLFLVLVPLLGNCKRMFFSISQRIPFSNLK